MKSHVYLQQENNTRTFKIGKANNPRTRVKQNQTGNSRVLTNSVVLPFACSRKALRFENAMHTVFKLQHVRGEFYTLSRSDVRLIKRLHKIATKKPPSEKWKDWCIAGGILGCIGLIVLISVKNFAILNLLCTFGV